MPRIFCRSWILPVGNLQLAGKGEGRIDIAFLRTLGSDFVPRILRRFLDENQGKQIDFALHCDKVITNEILKGIKEQKYDIGFCSKINDEPLIEFIPVAKQDLVVIVPPDHPLASKSEIHLEETLEYKQIIYKSGSGLRHIIDHLSIRLVLIRMFPMRLRKITWLPVLSLTVSELLWRRIYRSFIR